MSCSFVTSMFNTTASLSRRRPLVPRFPPPGIFDVGSSGFLERSRFVIPGGVGKTLSSSPSYPRNRGPARASTGKVTQMG